MHLYHEMKRNKLRSIWDSTVSKDQVACWCVFVYNKSNAAILKLKFVELRHQTRSPVSLTDGKKIMLTTVFQLDELVRKIFNNTIIKIPWISNKENYTTVSPFKPGSLAVAWYESFVVIAHCFYHHYKINFVNSSTDGPFQIYFSLTYMILLIKKNRFCFA